MTNIIAFDSKVKKGSETVGCVGKESDGGAELRYRLYNPAVWLHSDLRIGCCYMDHHGGHSSFVSDPCQRTQS